VATERVPFVLMRGGSSRGPVVRGSDLPSDPGERDDVVLKILGSPQAAQVDGLGGAQPITSKLVVVDAPGDDDEADAHYQVANAAITTADVDWAGTCGNMTAAAALFVLEQVRRDGRAPSQSAVRLRNRSTGKIIHADVRSAGVGAEARLLTRHLDPGGSVTGRLLPTGSAADVLETDWGSVRATILDVAHPFVMVPAKDVLPDAAPARLTDLLQQEQYLTRVEQVRVRAQQRMAAITPECQQFTGSDTVPRIALTGHDGAFAATVQVTCLSFGRVLASLPVTAALCLAVAAMTPGSVLWAGPRSAPDGTVTIGYPAGTRAVEVEMRDGGVLAWVGLAMTARTIAEGVAFVVRSPQSIGAD